MEREIVFMPATDIFSTIGDQVKENVTFYARVSTDMMSQDESYERQKAHFEELIKARSDWNYVEGYADQGITGTRADKRTEFLRMMEDCKAGKINRILVKSISRFARNTIDALHYIKELKERHISIYFENEKIDTLTPNGEVLITILAALAEQESRTISKNIKWSYQKRFQDGLILISASTLGYKKNKVTGIYEIVKEEAEIVQRIFREYVNGYTIREIADGLTADGILTKRGNKFHPGSIEMILENEKYTGNSICGKTFKLDVTSEKRVKNTGQGDRYYIPNSHEAIISQELYDKAQAERKRRSELRSSFNTGKGKYSNKYPFSNILVCGKCGGKFRRSNRKIASGEKVNIWTCLEHKKGVDSCDMLPIKEDDIYAAYVTSVTRLCGDLSDIITIAKNSIEEEMKNDCCEDLRATSEKLKEERNRMVELFRQKTNNQISQEEYNIKSKELAIVIRELEQKETELTNKHSLQKLKYDKINEVNKIINEFDITQPQAIRLLLKEARVMDKHRIEFIYDCGLTDMVEF